MRNNKTILQHKSYRLSAFCKQLVAVLVFGGLFQTTHAQGEWKWAHCWSGDNGISPGNYYNQISATAFDDNGNLYVYGMMGGSAILDGSLLPFYNDTRVLLSNIPAILLAKFDTLGNMLWYKVVKQSATSAMPNWMEVRDGKVYVSGNCGFNGDSHHEWLYYMDSLIEEEQITSLPDSLQKPPFKRYTLWTFFAIFDLDGNLLENHFVEKFSREYIEPAHLRLNSAFCYCYSTYAPFHVDRDGNWYVFNPTYYKGPDSLPYTVVVYGDTNKVYDLYLPGSITPSTPHNAVFCNVLLYKFSPEWDLLNTKFLVDHVEGMNPKWPNGGDSICAYTCNYHGISFDEEDNMYLSGYIQMTDCLPNSGGMNHHYPVHYYWDSIHRLTAHDITSAAHANFIVKYDTAGNVLWCNQLHTKGQVIHVQANTTGALTLWHGNTLSDNYIYITGRGEHFINDSTTIFFDNESDTLQRYTEIQYSDGLVSTGIGFFARYDKNTGTYVNHGIIPAERVFTTKTSGIVNNRVFNFAKFGFATLQTNLFVEWRNDGQLIKIDSVNGWISPDYSFGTVANERGYVATALLTEGNMRFSNTVETNCSNGDFNAVFALYYDPEFAEPYVGIPERPQQFLTLKVWPNPTIQTLQIACEETLMESVTVLDMTGLELQWQPVSDNQCQIDLSPLPAGMYLLKVVSNGRAQYEKFVKSAY